MDMTIFADVLHNNPGLSALTLIALCISGASLVLYLISRVPELMLACWISLIYGIVPAIPMLRHL